MYTVYVVTKCVSVGVLPKIFLKIMVHVGSKLCVGIQLY